MVVVKELPPTIPELVGALRKSVAEILDRDAPASFSARNENWFVCNYDPKTHPGLGDTFFKYENLTIPLFASNESNKPNIGEYSLPLTRGHVEKLSLGDASKKEDGFYVHLFVYIVFAVEFNDTKFRILAKLDLTQEHLEFSFLSGGSETVLERKDARIASPQLQEILNILNGL